MENRELMLTVDKLPLIEEAFASIDNMEKFCNKILDSRLAPDHFYPKLPGSNDRDYTKGNTAAVMMVLIHGNQLHLPVLTSLQQIVPVNGLLSIKGDGAKGIILGSGKVQVNTWVETESGSIEEGTYQVTVSAERSDTHEKLSRTFSIAQAKRAGLWITEQQANGPDGWKYKKSAWYKFPDRMVKYRALGFLARDLFPDVMAGTYTTEEAMDIPRDTTETIETPSGATIIIPDKEHSQKRAGKMTSRVADKIKAESFAPVDAKVMQPIVINESEKIKWAEPIEDNTGKGQDEVIMVPHDPAKPPFVPEKGSVSVLNGEVVAQEGTPINLEGKETKELLEIINTDTDMIEAMELIPGKNTNKKLRGIIEAHQSNKLTEYVASILPPAEKTEEQPIHTESIPVNKSFDQQKGIVIEKTMDLLDTNKMPDESFFNEKYQITIPGFDKDNVRDFAVTKNLFNLLASLTPAITGQRYSELAIKKGILSAFPDKEIFLKKATAKFISELLDIN